MKRVLLSIFSTLVIGAGLLAQPAFVLAQATPAPTNAAASAGSATTPAANPGSSAQLTNPLGTTSLPILFGRIAKAFIGILGAVALLMYIIGGILWMTAGDSKRVETGKTMLVNSTIGLLIVFFSYFIAIAFLAFFGAR